MIIYHMTINSFETRFATLQEAKMVVNNSLCKKFFRSQAQRAGNRQMLEARKKLHKPELVFAKAWAVWKFWYDYFARDVFYSGTHLCLIKRICISAPVYF